MTHDAPSVGQLAAIAALNEIGVDAYPVPGTRRVRVSRGAITCEVAYRASVIARKAAGSPPVPFDAWHKRQHRFTCMCEKP